MKTARKVLLRALALACSGAMLLHPFAAQALNDGKMAHNIYITPHFKDSSKQYDAYMVDFRSNENPPGTYWELCDYRMDCEGSRELYPGLLDDMRAYAGLQRVEPVNGEVAIQSYWRARASQGTYIYAKRVFPEGEEHEFGGEGEGTNYIGPYDWEAGKWYRMVLRCWEDKTTGRTFIGQWFIDLETGVWTLISIFNTQFQNSFIEGNMTAFMENFLPAYADPERDINVKNFYVIDHQDGEWKTVEHGTETWSVKAATLGFDRYNEVGNNNKRGGHSYGTDTDEGGDFIWGKSSGILPDGWGSTLEFDDAAPNTVPVNITQPDKPTLPGTAVKDLTIAREGEGWAVRWAPRSRTTPHLSYRVQLFNAAGEPLGTQEGTVTGDEYKVVFPDVGTDALRCVVTVTDLFGGEAERSVCTPALEIVPGDFNGDGCPTITDVTVALEELSRDSASPTVDLTGDGKITLKDVTRLLTVLEEEY